MAVLSFTNYRPAPRYDSIPWVEVVIDEGDSSTGPWTEIDTIAFDGVDEDPANPATRSFTTLNSSGDPDAWYRLTFGDADGNTQPPILHADNVEPWAGSAELAVLLRVNEVTNAVPLERVLSAAAGEIQEEIGPIGALTGWKLDLATEVNIERAVEHWQQMQSPFGILGLGSDFGPAYTTRDSWDRHAAKLAPLKTSWGLA